jgi:ketosteroid isomerase-like protein
MAEDNVELFRRCAQAVTDDDEASLLQLTDSELEVVALRSGTEGAFHGHDGVRAFLADNRVLALGAIHVRGRESGIDTEVPTAVIATFRDGLLVRFVDYSEREKALAAAGIS